jgi:PiT family inorganic phosphate transporter/sodium-dependent phosphate transporter
LFITISGGHGISTPEELGAGKAYAIVPGVFAGITILSPIFFLPYYYRK